MGPLGTVTSREVGPMHVVVGVDGSDASLTAVDLVTGTIWPTGTRIWLVSGHELPDWTGFAPASSNGDPPGEAQRSLFEEPEAGTPASITPPQQGGPSADVAPPPLPREG